MHKTDTKRLKARPQTPAYHGNNELNSTTRYKPRMWGSRKLGSWNEAGNIGAVLVNSLRLLIEAQCALWGMVWCARYDYLLPVV